MSLYPIENVLKNEKNQKLWNMILNHGVEILDEKKRRAGRTRYCSTKELLLEYIDKDIEQVRRAKKRVRWT